MTIPQIERAHARLNEMLKTAAGSSGEAIVIALAVMEEKLAALRAK